MITKYAYLIMSLSYLAIWLFLFWKRKDVRKEMLIMSITIGFAGPISEYWYFKDYWLPPMLFGPAWPFGGVEDYLWGFAIGGIAAAVYEVFLRRRLVCSEAGKRRHNWALLVFPPVIIAAMILLTDIFGMNSIYASSASFLVLFAIVVKLRPDLFKDAIFSGLFIALVMFLFYLVYLGVYPRFWEEVWHLYGTPHGLLILGRVPLTELLWGMTWGMAAGPFYEFWRGCRLRAI